MTPVAIPASLPPQHLPGLEASWSRLVRAPSGDGQERTWHVLDGAPLVAELTGAPPVGVVLAVHGNPTWSYLWRSVLAAAARVGWRVVAVDQLEMGFSERTGALRPLAMRLDDLDGLTDALDIGTRDIGTGDIGTGGGGAAPPVVALGHDWGGVVAGGWAGRHRGALAGIVLTNTAVHPPAGTRVPPLLRPAMAPAVTRAFCVSTTGFLRATLATARTPLAPGVARAYLAPYRTAARREGIGGFVADIPVDPGDPSSLRHPSRPSLDAVAAGLAGIGGAVGPPTPSLIVWGSADPVFRPRYLADLRSRLPHGDVHLVAGAGHLLLEDADVAAIIARWLAALVGAGPGFGAGRPRDVPIGAGAPRAKLGLVPGSPQGRTEPPAPARTPVTAALAERAAATPDESAVVQLQPDGAPPLVCTWRQLETRVAAIAAGLAAAGVRPGQRVSLLVPPGPDLSALFCACLRLGAVVVVADAGLGVRGLSRAVTSAAPDVVVAVERGLLAAAALRWPGRRIAVGPVRGGARAHRLLGVSATLDDVVTRGRPTDPVDLPPEAPAAVLFTSGSTGPAKGVVYTRAQLTAMLDVLITTYDLGPATPLVAAFAPFALLGPLLGAATAVPAIDVTAPHTLTARLLADAVAAVGARVVFASPAALRNTVATADDLRESDHDALAGVTLLLSAGAPVGVDLLAAAAALVPAAGARTPYGMTEALPVTDVTLAELQAAPPGEGVLVGAPVPGVRVAVAPLDALGRPAADLTTEAGLTGEVAVAGPHVKDRYDQLWDVQRASAVNPGWHRTGDVGHLDDAGRLWIEGRLAHVVATAEGVATPVGAEQRIQALAAHGPAAGLGRAALVGVGPAGTQVPVAVVETAAGPGPAPVALLDAVRAAAGTPVEVAAVLLVERLPTDVRHRSKIDRTRVAGWAGEVLAGRARADRTPW